MSLWERPAFPIRLPATAEEWKLFGGTIPYSDLTVVVRPTAEGRKVNTHSLPPWSPEFVGSETIHGDHRIAVVGKRSSISGLGIDYQRTLTLEEAAMLSSSIATTEELTNLVGTIPDLANLLALLLSAKESTFKCLYPLVGSFFELSCVEVVEIDLVRRTFRLQLRKDLSTKLRAGKQLIGHFGMEADGVHTLVGLLTTEIVEDTGPRAKIIPFRRVTQ